MHNGKIVLFQTQGNETKVEVEVIEDRHGRNATLMASQLPVSDWYDVLEKKATIADAILDRLAKTSHTIALRGESYRK